MDFDQSTQAQCWMFDRYSLYQCKQRASVIRSLKRGDHKSIGQVSKDACGFYQRYRNAGSAVPLNPLHKSLETTSMATMATMDQDILVHFHSHQIQRLVGPNAIFPELRRSASVLSTAIMLFRRFYLSNSVIDFHPRNIAAASALLAVKVDCERNLEIAILSHATSIVNLKAHKASLCRDELRAVTIEEIEEAERNLLAALDFRLRCHHPYGAIRVLAGDIAASITELTAAYHKPADFFGGYYSQSPRGIDGISPSDPHRLDSLCERAIAVAQAALVYSDVNFLYPPGKIAFAAVAIALEGKTRGGCLGQVMTKYLHIRFPHKSTEELDDFERDVTDIIYEIENCPEIDLLKFYAPVQRRFSSPAQQRAIEIRRVFSVAAYFRGMVESKKIFLQTPDLTFSHKKRTLEEAGYPCSSYQVRCKVARVTPNQTPYFGTQPYI